MEEVRPTLEEKKTNLLVSLAAGVTLKQLQQMAGNHTRVGRDYFCTLLSTLDLQKVLLNNCKIQVIRLMPNTPCVVGEGASVFSRGAGATDNDCAAVATLLSAVGDCHEVVEAMIDGVTGVSGSGVAYMYLIIGETSFSSLSSSSSLFFFLPVEAMADGGVKQGLPRDLAYRLAAQTMVGAGQMVLRTRSHPAVLKDEVCSPGGTTIAALDILEKSGLRTSMMQAVEAAAKRCHELTQ